MSIKVGKQYKDAFKSICNLYRNGAVNRDVIQSIEGNTFIQGTFIEQLLCIMLDQKSKMGERHSS